MRATLPPARYSADPDDALGFANYQNAKAEFDGLQPVVYLDGEELRHVVSADEVEVIRAWMPWVFLSVFVTAWGAGPIKAFLNGGPAGTLQGMEMLAQLREVPAWRELPVVILSGFGELVNRDVTRRLGTSFWWAESRRAGR